MVSKIEQLIDELQNCIDDAKPKFMDSTKIIVEGTYLKDYTISTEDDPSAWQTRSGR